MPEALLAIFGRVEMSRCPKYDYISGKVKIKCLMVLAWLQQGDSNKVKNIDSCQEIIDASQKYI